MHPKSPSGNSKIETCESRAGHRPKTSSATPPKQRRNALLASHHLILASRTHTRARTGNLGKIRIGIHRLSHNPRKELRENTAAWGFRHHRRHQSHINGSLGNTECCVLVVPKSHLCRIENEMWNAAKHLQGPGGLLVCTAGLGSHEVEVFGNERVVSRKVNARQDCCSVRVLPRPLRLSIDFLI